MNLPEFECDDPVFAATRLGTNPLSGTIVQTNRNWSNEVKTPSGVVRINRCQTRRISSNSSDCQQIRS